MHQVVERLLSISGEDLLTVDRKYREPWSGKLPSRFLILSNELPRFGDASGAIANRFVVLAMHESFLGKENHTLDRRTDRRADRHPVLVAGRTRPTQSAGQVHRTESPPPTPSWRCRISFRRSRRTSGTTAMLASGTRSLIADLFADWRTWCEDNGHKPGSVQTFGRDLRAVIPHLRVVRPREGETKRKRRYAGLRLSTAHNG